MNAKRLQIIVLFLALAAVAGLAQQQQAPPAKPPEVPPRGPLAIGEKEIADIIAGIKAPAGFQVKVFAAPPTVNYPTCITATMTGELFVCVDRNGSLQTDPGMGSVLRLVDRNSDGQADEYTVFAKMDSPRGVVWDGQTLYVSHPPLLTSFRDTDGDGISDESKVLVRGLGFGLDFRGADHTTNGVEAGIDGWLYVAVGDYGIVKAVGTDAREIQMRGGGIVRVRPDGRELEVYSQGTRNDYDVAIDPYLNMFARGNTNDGGGWDIRLNHFVAGAKFGYPALFRNFTDEVIAPLADYGGGSGTGMLYVQDPGLPAGFGDTLYSVDWGTSSIYRHTLTPRGSTFTVGQELFLGLPRPNDMVVDGGSRLYVASWRGGQFRYAGESIGYVAQLTAAGAKPPVIPDLRAANDARLVELVASSNQTHRRFAQQELLRRGRTAERIGLLEKRVLGSDSLAGRTSAIFTLKQLAGADANPILAKAAADATVREFALRALADRQGELANVPKALFTQGLADANPRVQLQAITGLKRMGAVDSAKALLPLTTSADPVVPHIAIDALVSLGATDAALATLATGSAADVKGALRVLQQIHTPATVSGLISALTETRNAQTRVAILQSLSRLYHRDGVWKGTLQEWWTTRPDTTGPYYDPVVWEQSARILPMLRNALLQASGGVTTPADIAQFTLNLERNRLLPPGGGELLGAMRTANDPGLPAAADALLGSMRLDVDAVTGPVLDRAAKARPAYRTAVIKMIAAAGAVSSRSADILRLAAIDATTPAETRATALTSLATAQGPEALARSIDGFASLNAGPGLDPALERAWRQFVATPSHAASLDPFRELVASPDKARQVLGYAVIVQLAAEPVVPAARGGAAGGRGGAPARGGGAAPARGGGGGGRGGRGGFAVDPATIEKTRAEARALVESAWTGPSVASLLRAIGLTEAAGYEARVKSFASSTTAEVRDAAAYAATRAPAAAAAAAPTTGAGAAVVSTVPFEELATRVAGLTGDVAAGRALFTRQACASCHTTDAAETPKGPPLGGIATRYSRAELIESIVRPAAKVAQGFATNAFETKDGRLLTGFVTREGNTDVVVRDIAGVETTLQKNIITNRRVLEGSVMPPGLVDALTIQELASLLAFLGSTTGK